MDKRILVFALVFMASACGDDKVCRKGESQEGKTVCGLNDEGVFLQECQKGAWVDTSTCTGTHVCENDTLQYGTTTCGLNDEGVFVQNCTEGAWVNSTTCTGTHVCANETTQNGTTACGLNNEGVFQQNCTEGAWVDSTTCVDIHVCVNDATQNGSTVCGLNDEGVFVQNCTEGAWVNSTTCTGTHVCANETTQNGTTACGLNNEGVFQQNCTEGAWVDSTTCIDPHVCVNETTQNGTTACGLNNEGVFVQNCTEGAWVESTTCTGSHVCVNDATQNGSTVCGIHADGVLVQECSEGAWVDSTTCAGASAFTSASGLCQLIGGEDKDVYIGIMASFGGNIWPVPENATIPTLAINEINAGGGIAGQSLGAVLCDSQCDVDSGSTALSEIIALDGQNNGVDIGVVVGPSCSYVVLQDGGTPLYETVGAANMVMIGATTESADLTSADTEGWFFRTISADTDWTKAQAAYLYVQANWRKLAIIYPNLTYEQGRAEAARDAFAAHAEVDASDVSLITYDTNSLNSTTVLAAVDGHMVDGEIGGALLFGNSSDATFVGLFTAIDSYTWTNGTPEWDLDVTVSAEIFTEVDNATLMTGMGGTVRWTPRGAGSSHFAAALGDSVDPYFAELYDAVYMAAIGVSLAGSGHYGNGAFIRTSLSNSTSSGSRKFAGDWAGILAEIQSNNTVDFFGATGPVDFDENGDVSTYYTRQVFDESGNYVHSGCWDVEWAECPALSPLLLPELARTSEGDSENSAPFDDQGGRFQSVYGASMLTGLAVGAQLTGIRFRLNTGQEAFDATTIENFEIRLSTSANEPEALSTTFADNRGSDEVIVRTGSLSIAADDYPVDGEPNDFGPTIEFSTPFVYAGGSLLLEIGYSEVPSGAKLVDKIYQDPNVTLDSESVYADTGFNATSANVGRVVDLIVVEYVFTEP